MNKKDCLIFCTVIIMSVLFVFHTVYEDRTRTFQYREAYNKKCAYIGGITIGTDSLEAIGFIKKRLKYINGNVEIVSKGDSIGYYFPKYNEKYYVHITDGNVTRIYFHSDSLTNKEVEIIAGGNRFFRNRLICYKGDTWTAFQDGKGTYMVYKN